MLGQEAGVGVQRFLGGEVDAAHVVDLGDRHGELLPLVHHVGDVLHAGGGQLGDVDQAFLAGKDLDERAEVHDALHRADVGLAHDRLLDQAFHHLLRPLGAFLQVVVDGDRPVVVDVDLGTGLLAHALDVLAARADDQPDLFRGHLEGDDLGGEIGDVAARLGDGLVHDPQDVQPAFARLSQRLCQDFRAHPLDLDVHLEGRDAVFGSGNLEVHVAEVILLPEDVAQDDELVAFLHQAHGDARNGLLHPHARVQEAQGAAAHGGHGGGAVGLEDFRDDAQGVREVFLLGEDHADGPLRQVAVPDLAAAGRPEPPDFPHRERREVVVQHEVLPAVAVDVVHDLLVQRGARAWSRRAPASPRA